MYVSGELLNYRSRKMVPTFFSSVELLWFPINRLHIKINLMYGVYEKKNQPVKRKSFRGVAESGSSRNQN